MIEINFNKLVALECVLLIAIIEALCAVIRVVCYSKSRPKRVWHINKKMLLGRIIIILYCVLLFICYGSKDIHKYEILLLIRNIEIPLTILSQFLVIPIGMLTFVSPKGILTEGRLFKNSEKISYKVNKQMQELYIVEIYVKKTLYREIMCNEEMLEIINKHYILNA